MSLNVKGSILKQTVMSNVCATTTHDGDISHNTDVRKLVVAV